LLVILAPGERACAQGSSLSLDLGVSYSLPPAGGTGVASTYANGGLRLDGSFGYGGYYHAAGLGGLALSEEGASWGAFVAGAGWVQPLSGTMAVGLAAMGEAFTVGDPVPYRAAYAAAEPDVRFASGGTSVRVSGYGAIGTSVVTVVETFVRDTRFGPRVFEVGFPVTSDLWAWGGGAEVGQRLGALTPSLAVEGYDSPQGPYSVARLGLEVRPEGGVLYLEGAVWDTPYGREFVLFAGLQVLAGGRSSVVASGGRYGPDPLLDAPAAGSLGAGVSLELARFEPAPELVWQVVEDGGLTLVLALKAPGAASVECAGDFADWERIPMQREGDIWRVTLPVAPGAYHFGFFVDGEWYVPPGVPGLAEDEWGEIQGTIVVGDPSAAPDVTP
jgi:hypothetical protein